MFAFLSKTTVRAVLIAAVAVTVLGALWITVRGSSGPTKESPVAAQVLVATQSVQFPDSVTANPAPATEGAIDPTNLSGAATDTSGGSSTGPSADSKDQNLAPGELPVTVLAYTDFISRVTGANANLTDASVNSATHMTAVAIAEVGKSEPTAIVSTTFLDAQLPRLLAVYDTAKASLIVNPGNSTVTRRGPYGVVSSTPVAAPGAAATDSGFGTLRLLLLIAAGVMAFAMFMRWRMIRRTKQEDALSGTGGKGGADRPETRFRDVAGCEEAVEDLEEIVDFLKSPEKYTKAGAKAPKGVLLIGPPGTGKTLLARAVAGEAGVPFFSASGSDFVEMYVGVGAKRVRELFSKARQFPEGAIIFIDEVDSVGRKRSSGNNQHPEQEGTLNALLVEMDGFTKSNVIVIAATNRDDILDPALTRPGRLDRKVSVGLPDRRGREQILEVHCSNKPVRADVDLNLVARRTPGMSGAELAQIVNEACLFAARDDREVVTNEDFDHAIATVAMGKARTSAVVTEHDRTVTAWHEAGHTAIGMVLPDAMEPVSVSIIPRGPAGGVTWFSQGDDLFLTRKQAFARLVVSMGGRAAEELLLDGEFTSGPYGDIQQATNTAIAMITKYGMTEHGLAHRPEEILASGSQIGDDVWAQADALLADALVMARETLAAHRDLFDAIVTGLLENDTLTAMQLQEIAEGREITPMPLPQAPKDYKKHNENDSTGSNENGPVRYIPESLDDDDRKRGGWLGPSRRRRGRVANAISAAVQEWRKPGQGKPGRARY